MTTTDPATASPDAPAAPAGAMARRWRDAKKPYWALGLIVPLIPFATVFAATRTGWSILWWSGPLWLFVLMPILDTALGRDAVNPPDWAVPQLEADRYYRWCTWLFIPLQYAALVFACWAVVTHDLSPFAWVGWALSMGAVGGIAINTAHELGHKRDKLERRLSKVALAQTGYGHFYVEHNRGHHARVSTPDDPASSRLGESFWRFLPRTVIGSLRSAWDLETDRLRRHDRRWWSPRNEILNAWAMTLVLFAGLAVAFGPRVLPFLVVQAVFGFSLLEIVNYIEHYGLLRQRVANGRYERCRPVHSWNANNLASNLALYHLERHSDHHANPTRRYQTLRHFDDAPQLPTGYAGMMVIAAIPPLWRKVMDPRVLDHYDGDVTRANIAPSARHRYPAPR